MIRTLPVEPTAAPWEPRPLSRLLDELLTITGPPSGRPSILGVDGRQGSGKTTAAERFAALVPQSIVVHSDDVAWWESFFGWDHLMAEGILEPLRRGQDVDYQPPAWAARGRSGSIVVPSSTRLVAIEGVGVSRRSLAPSLDAAVWVQSDWDEANQRGIAREGGDQDSVDFWWEWDREEQPFLAEDRPWERADLVICGTPRTAGIDYELESEVLVGRSLRR